MTDAVQAPAPPTIWEALTAWAKSLKQWQQAALDLAVKHGRLSDDHVNSVYGRFLSENGLGQGAGGGTTLLLIAAPTMDGENAVVQLRRIDTLTGVNALRPDAALSFGPKLTVIYGRNGAGKSGFARLLANACFCRHNPEIIQDIYDDGPPSKVSAHFHLKVGGQDVGPVVYPGGEGIERLKSTVVFDRVVAERHVSASMTFGFKPAGFDIFPELSRVYSAIATQLQAAISAKTTENTYIKTFLGEETIVSQAIATLGNQTDLNAIKKLAKFGDTERARFDLIETQLQGLRSKSTKDTIDLLNAATLATKEMGERFGSLASMFSEARRSERNHVAEKARRAAEALAAAGVDQFKRDFFKTVGSPAWEEFIQAAHTLGRNEHDHYPDEGAHCLLCERPLDVDSRKHIEALFAFVEGERQKELAEADAAVAQAIANVQGADYALFAEGSVVREYVHKLKPDLEKEISGAVEVLAKLRQGTVEALRTRTNYGEEAAALAATSLAVEAFLAELQVDVERLGKENQEDAIRELEQERHLLRHREVLSSILVNVEEFVNGASWCAKAEKTKPQLNTKRITDKEKELFGEVLGEAYRTRLAEECAALGCDLPVEMRTQGKGGETLRSLLLKGGHKPDRILSEGEQKAVALADFLTEVGLNPNNGGIALDDPVSSQDHDRKALIATRLVKEASARQVIVFTHDLVFLNQLVTEAEKTGTAVEKHRIDRDANGKPGQVKLGDVPALSKDYDTAHQAGLFLAEAKKATGTSRDHALREGFGALRRTSEEIIPKFLLKGVVPRWSDRVIVGGLTKINWDDALADEIVAVFEELSKYIEGHTHTEEAMGAPPQVKDLEAAIERVDALIKRAKVERKKGTKPA